MSRWQRVKYAKWLTVQVVADLRPLNPVIKISAYSGNFRRVGRKWRMG